MKKLEIITDRVLDVVEDTATPHLGTLRGLVTLLAGVVFGYGLGLSTMIRPQIVLQFLSLKDFGLVLVLGGAVLVALPFLVLAPKGLRVPLLGGNFERHAATFDFKLVLGSALFGIGWGMTGLCPGPAIASLGAGNWEALLVLAGLFFGALLQGLVANWAAR